jgi:hypothetical protein
MFSNTMPPNFSCVSPQNVRYKQTFKLPRWIILEIVYFDPIRCSSMCGKIYIETAPPTSTVLYCTYRCWIGIRAIKWSLRQATLSRGIHATTSPHLHVKIHTKIIFVTNVIFLRKSVDRDCLMRITVRGKIWVFPQKGTSNWPVLVPLHKFACCYCITTV